MGYQRRVHGDSRLSNQFPRLELFKPNQTQSIHTTTEMESVKDAANYVGDKASELTSGASKEANKNVAKDSNADASTRATAAKDALGDKLDESKNSASAEGNKQKTTH